MADEFLNNSENNEGNVQAEKFTDEEKAKQKPRRRKIVRNCSLLVSAIIVVLAVLTVFVWRFFFDQSVTGSWYYIDVADIVETYDAPADDDAAETADTVQENIVTYEERVSYKFNDDGTCSATVGTVTIPGSYYIAADEDGNLVICASIVYNYMPLLYGNYPYKVEGNVLTGRQLVMYDENGEELYRLDSGEGESPLEPFDDFATDEELLGEWRSDEMGATYRFDEDGRMYLTGDEGMEYEMEYTIMDGDSEDTSTEYGVILCKFESRGEQSYSYTYSITDGVLSLNGIELTRIS